MSRLAAVLVLLLAGGAARAEEPVTPDDAQRLFLAGRQAFENGRLDLAALSFEAAYRAQPLPALLWNLGQTYQRRFIVEQSIADLRRAVNAYRTYLQQSPNGPNRNEATRLLTELTPMLVRLEPKGIGESPAAPPAPSQKTELLVLTEAEHATVRVDDGAEAAAPALVEVKPGEHRARVEAPGYQAAELKLTAVDGRLVTAEARLTARPALLSVGGPPAGSVAVDGRGLGKLPLVGVELPAGAHLVSVTGWGKEPFSERVTLPRGGHVSVEASLRPTRQRRASRWVAIAAGLAGAMTVAAGAVWGQAESSALDLLARQRIALTGDQAAQYEEDRSRRDAWRIGTGICIGITGALAVTAVGLLVFDSPK
jgi:tetratricopeptide (TPR) repeat protein